MSDRRCPTLASTGCGRAAPASRAWLRVKAARAAAPFRATAGLLDELDLHTVCDEARCPNRGECFAAGTATFLILGDACTRACGFCAIGRVAGPAGGDRRRRAAPRGRGAPRRLGPAPRGRDQRHPRRPARRRRRPVRGDGRGRPRGAAGGRPSRCSCPTFGGDAAALRAVLAAAARRAEPQPRDRARACTARCGRRRRYARSLALLARGRAGARAPGAGGPTLVKTGLMLGLGETAGEVAAVLADCAAAGVDAGHRRPVPAARAGCLPVARYVPPDEFAALAPLGERLGLRVVAGPFVRSSYRAAETFAAWADRAPRAAAASRRGPAPGRAARRPVRRRFHGAAARRAVQRRGLPRRPAPALACASTRTAGTRPSGAPTPRSRRAATSAATPRRRRPRESSPRRS